MTQYIGIHSEGGLIPYDVLDKIAKEESGLGQQAKDFGLSTGRRLTDEISRGCLVADVPAIVGSIDIVMGEIDR